MGRTCSANECHGTRSTAWERIAVCLSMTKACQIITWPYYFLIKESIYLGGAGSI